MFSEVRDATTNPNPTYDTLASLNLFPSLSPNANGLQPLRGVKRGGTPPPPHIYRNGSQPPRGVREGDANKFGLFNVLCNALEWCDDKSGAGFEFDTAFKKTPEYNFLFLDHKYAEGQSPACGFCLCQTSDLSVFSMPKVSALACQTIVKMALAGNAKISSFFVDSFPLFLINNQRTEWRLFLNHGKCYEKYQICRSSFCLLSCCTLVCQSTWRRCYQRSASITPSGTY